MAQSSVREFIYLDWPRVASLAQQLGVTVADDSAGSWESAFLQVEAKLVSRAKSLDAAFDFSKWVPETFADGQFALARGLVRLLDYAFLSAALNGLPAVLRKMSKMEMEALRNSEQGKRMSKTQLQQRSQENQVAIARVEEFKFEELGSVVRQQYGDLVRVKVRPSEEHPQCLLVGSAYSRYFADTPAAMSQKYGLEVDAGWTVFGQINMPNLAANPQPMPVGNQMEDGFEQIALLMNNAFRVANSVAWPAVSMTVIGMYRAV